MSNSSGGGEAGFALLETIIAFVILALSLGVGIETISLSTRTFQRAGDAERASEILSGLNTHLLPGIGEAGASTGADGKAEWAVTAQALSDDHARPLLAVTIAIWPRGPSGPRFLYRTFSSGGGE